MRGDPTLPAFKLTQDNEALPLYGLLTALLRPIFVIEGEEEIRCKPCMNLALPLLFGGSMGIASECSIGVAEEPPTSSITSGMVFAMVHDFVGCVCDCGRFVAGFRVLNEKGCCRLMRGVLTSTVLTKEGREC